MANKEQYAIAVVMEDGRFQFVTEILPHKVAKWENGKKAMLFDKSVAKDIVNGLLLNWTPAVAVLSNPCVVLENGEENE